MKILVADDDVVSRKVLESSLGLFGHKVILAANGIQALECLTDEGIDVVVSDWMMPGLNGLELCRMARELPAKNYLYFIMLTGTRTSKENYREAMEAGVDDFLTKPLDKDQLFVRLRVAERIISCVGEVRELRSLLPMCSYCRRIRHEDIHWKNLESYLEEHAGTDFSHGICPECYETHVKPQLSKVSVQPSTNP
jgi:phosphoserine phosphatase RsbU/P